MLSAIPEPDFIDILKAGVHRTTRLMGQLTEYHGGPVMTEYLLTADIAREFIEKGYPVNVEYLNRRLVNAMTALKSAQSRKMLKARRTDVAVVSDGLIPLALIEIKIRVKKLRAIKVDLDKITATMRLLKARYAANAIGAVVFQVHIPGSDSLTYAAQFQAEAEAVESALNTELSTYAVTRPDFNFRMVSLQSPTGGVVQREIEYDGEEGSWGQHGHATRYHAVIIRSLRPLPPRTGTFEDVIRDGEE